MINNYNALFIDDDNTLLEIYDIMFRNEFKNLFLVNNKKKLDNVLSKNKIDIIFCDLRLKNHFLEFDERGDKILRYIKKKYGKKSCWIISGLSRKDIYEKYDINGLVNGVIEKPFEKKDILQIFGL